MRCGVDFRLWVLGRGDDVIGYLSLQIWSNDNQIRTIERLMIGKSPNVAHIDSRLAKVNASTRVEAIPGHIISIETIIRQVKPCGNGVSVDANQLVVKAGQVGRADQFDGTTEEVSRWDKHIGARVLDGCQVVGWYCLIADRACCIGRL